MKPFCCRIMVGSGEMLQEVKQSMRDQRIWGVNILTVGGHLQPSKGHHQLYGSTPAA